MAECLKQADELGKEGLLQDGVHKAVGLNDDLFIRYLAFLDDLIEHQAAQEQSQGFLAKV